MNAITIHTAKTTMAVRPRSPRHRATLVREAAARDGWAYATCVSGPGVRVVLDSSIESVPSGSTHMALDVWAEDEAKAV